MTEKIFPRADEIEAANKYFREKKPLCRFYMHNRKDPFYGNVVAIEASANGEVTYTIEYDLAGAKPDDRKEYAVINMAYVEILKTRRPGFWGWLKQWF